MPIAPSVLKKAVRNNPIYAQRLGWKERYQQISQKIGFTNMSPGPEAFAEGVFRWQGSHPPLKADGILGPKTWEKLEPQTRFTAAGPLPEWLRAPPPAPAVPSAADEQPEISTNIWFGLAVDFGGHAVVWGRNTMYAQLYSLDTYHRRFRIESERNRWGPGLGGGVGVGFMMISGLQQPRILNGTRQTGVDFELSIGARWGALIKNAGKVRHVKRLLERADQSGGGVKRMVEFVRDNKQMLTRLSPEDWNNIRKRMVEMGDALDMEANATTPTVMTMAIPLPPPLNPQIEVSLYWQSGTLRVMGVVDDTGS